MLENKTHLKISSLEKIHKKYHAKMVDFAGWSMPINFPTGIIDEHLATRNSVGLFDISHMGQIIITGSDSCKILKEITPTNIDKLSTGKVKYSLLLNKSGGIIDDLMITNTGEGYYIVVNASRTQKDIELLKSVISSDHNINFKLLSNQGMIALQGPHSEKVLSTIFPEISKLYFMNYCQSKFNNSPVHISRLGYSGEDGFEVSAPSNTLLNICELILNDDRVRLCGLGARDTLRLEAGLPLYGNEINEETTPIQAGLDFAISPSRIQNKDFRGFNEIIKEIGNGAEKVRVGLLPEGRQPIRKDVELLKDEKSIGIVTSGGFSPSLSKPIAMGFIDREHSNIGTIVNASIRNKIIKMEVVKLPFTPHRYHKQAGR